jgi:hypothetical protein
MTIAILALAALSLAAEPPALPRPAIAPELRATDCTNAEQRKRLADRGEAALAAADPILQQANGAMNARMQAHGDRLVARGVWKEADRARFARQFFADPAFVDHGMKAMAVVVEIMDSLEALTGAGEDEQRRCRAMIGMLGHVEKGLAVADEGWRLVDRLYADEARRLGVTMD